MDYRSRVMNDWTKSASSLELLETLRKDLEMLYEVASRDDADNIDASLHVVDALKERHLASSQ